MTTPFGADIPPEEPSETTSPAPDESEEGQHTHWEPEPEAGDEPSNDQIIADGEPVEEASDPEVGPVTVKTDTEDITLEGAFMAPEGMYVTKAALPKILAHIQKGIHHDRNFHTTLNTLRSEVQTRERAEVTRQQALRSIDTAEATTYTKELEAIFKDEDSWLAFSENASHNIELLKARVSAAKTQATLEAMRQGINLDVPANQPTRQETQRAMADSVVENFNELVANTDLATLIPDVKDQDAVFSMLMRSPSRYVEKAPYDIPEIGVKQGEYVVNRGNLLNDAKMFAGFRSPSAPATSRADKLNTATLNAPKRSARPAPRNANPADRPPTNEREWRERMIRLARSS